MNSWSDESLLASFAKGRDEAFVVLMNRYSPTIKGYAVRIVRTEELAEEICTETFYRIAVQRGKWEYRGISFKSYLFRIAHNLAIDIIRKQKLHRRKEGEVIQFSEIQRQQSTPEEDVVQKERAQMLHRAMEELTVEERELIVLRTTHGFSSKEAAGILNITATQVDAKYAYARKKLKKTIGALYERQRRLS